MTTNPFQRRTATRKLRRNHAYSSVKSGLGYPRCPDSALLLKSLAPGSTGRWTQQAAEADNNLTASNVYTARSRLFTDPASFLLLTLCIRLVGSRYVRNKIGLLCNKRWGTGGCGNVINRPARGSIKKKKVKLFFDTKAVLYIKIFVTPPRF